MENFQLQMPTLVPLKPVSSSAHSSRYISLMEKYVPRLATRMYNVFMKQGGKYMKDRVVLFVEKRVQQQRYGAIKFLFGGIAMCFARRRKMVVTDFRTGGGTMEDRTSVSLVMVRRAEIGTE
jgi:hypothetical protein